MKQKTINMITKIAQKRWNSIKDTERYTKEDALIWAMEIVGEYSDFDPTIDEYQDMLSSII